MTVIPTTHGISSLLEELLARIADDVPGALGAALSVHHRGGPPLVAAAHGLSAALVPAQLDRFGGPVPTAGRTGEPVVTADVYADDRWPHLTLSGLLEHHPAHAAYWPRVRGIAALPSTWDTEGTLVLSVALDRPATEETLDVLRRHERLAAMALVVAEATRPDRTDQMLELLQSRAALEEAKGIVIALRRCDPEEAWHTLRRASQERNVKVRELAVALVELLAGAPAPQPDGERTIHPAPEARRAARQLLRALERRR
ncbi:Two-component response regulator, AmiR/NasT family, consists of REC and RNA-binding antiterminator (ANTAR) domains [Amycolatopsis tolypomycina]|uniref:Two-component response regulator, AmiR/NasT family, consists of REC and RNA-binding antiterminator (ANTAR) domains n=1 Tax=Amycolatopsis tolypomycina TaxID=208445 RepID=A0A1H4Y980_9PSEU|nr:ANTAR domain-containing protein [Amycolatopsis tolypomycina]SED14443.1 Two-component response regulator, AmiR/NasT family, consists of REC and RNA-binding antiterminator (ANTAR) domains [Amycolatopsis tolypomycina]